MAVATPTCSSLVINPTFSDSVRIPACDFGPDSCDFSSAMARYCFELSRMLPSTIHAAVRTVGIGSDPIKLSNDGALCVARAVGGGVEVVKNLDQCGCSCFGTARAMACRQSKAFRRTLPSCCILCAKRTPVSESEYSESDDCILRRTDMAGLPYISAGCDELPKVTVEIETGGVLAGAVYEVRLMTPTLNALDEGAAAICPTALSDVKNINRQITSTSGGIERVESVLSSCNKKWRARSAELISCVRDWC